MCCLPGKRKPAKAGKQADQLRTLLLYFWYFDSTCRIHIPRLFILFQISGRRFKPCFPSFKRGDLIHVDNVDRFIDRHYCVCLVGKPSFYTEAIWPAYIETKGVIKPDGGIKVVRSAFPSFVNFMGRLLLFLHCGLRI